MGKKWIGVDLDGTLSCYWSGTQGTRIGPPVEPMMDRVRDWLARGQNVKIFTARACDPTQIPLVREWLIENGLADLEITNIKDFNMIELWDDSAISVERNTGEVLGGRPIRILRPRSTS
jgi:hypothetical protein